MGGRCMCPLGDNDHSPQVCTGSPQAARLKWNEGSLYYSPPSLISSRLQGWSILQYNVGPQINK